MLFSEFQENTNCRDNAYNHKVFSDLEVMYMNSDLTKEQIYEYGKKLVDNSKSKEELELEANINQQIADFKRNIKEMREEIKLRKNFLLTETDPTWIKQWKNEIKWRKETIAEYRRRVNDLKWVLGL